MIVVNERDKTIIDVDRRYWLWLQF
jgi:hypothetical protein